MAERVLRLKGSDLAILSALIDLLVEYHSVNIDVYKPRLSRSVEVRITGDSSEADRVYKAIATFSAKVGWKIE